MAWGKSLLTTLAAVVLAFTMAMVWPSAADESQGAKALAGPSPSVLRIGFLEKLDSLNPYVGFSNPSYLYYSLVYDDLMGVGNDLEYIPNLATSWYAVPASDPELVSSGEPFGSVWQYNLSTTALWSDGEAFTADDVVFNINLNAGNYTSLWSYQPYAYFMKYAEKTGDTTVRVHYFDRSTGDPIPAAYGGAIFIPMLPKHQMENMTALEIGFAWTGVFASDQPAVGTGPFCPSSTIYNDWLAGQNITLLKNPNCHWESDYGKTVKFDRIEFRFFDDAAAMSLALQMGNIDIASFPSQDYYVLRNDVLGGSVSDITTFDGPRINQYWTHTGFNMNNAGPNPSRLDKVIRQAMAMTANKTYICDNFYLGLAEPGSTLIAPINSFWHYNLTASEEFEVDLAAANQMLEDGGYVDTNSDGIRECTASSRAVAEGWVVEGTPLTYDLMVRREYPEEKNIAFYLESEWAKIGVNIDIIVLDEVQLNTQVYMYQYDMVIWYWSSDLDPNYQLFVESKAAWNGWSDNKYYNASYEENYTDSVQAMDPSQRVVYVDNCQRIFYNDSAYIILAYPNQTYAWRTDTFSGWGDWAADPGRSIDNYWTGNPLWFDLVPIPPPLQASFTADPSSGDIATVFEFNATDTFFNDPLGQVEICWDWESDGTADTVWNRIAIVDHQYAAPGNYLVTLKARNLTGGFFDNFSLSLTVVDRLPVPSISVSATSGDNRTVFEFDASASTDLETPSGDLEVRWDWNGDGTWDTAWTTVKTASHKFDSAGTYDVALQVRDSANQTNESMVQITVVLYIVPEFPALIGPVLGLAVIAVAATAMRRRRR